MAHAGLRAATEAVLALLKAEQNVGRAAGCCLLILPVSTGMVLGDSELGHGAGCTVQGWPALPCLLEWEEGASPGAKTSVRPLRSQCFSAKGST